MFIENKYTKIYFNIIDVRKRITFEGYGENHHILPSSLGGSDDKENIVRLTAKEHFIVHHLLTKMLSDEDSKSKMWNAFYLMHIHTTSNRYFTPRTYAFAKTKINKHKSVLYMGENNPFYGKYHSEETKNKMKLKRIGRDCKNSDLRVHHFFHNDFGHEYLTQVEFRTKYELAVKGVSKIVCKYRKSYKGWIILDDN